MANNYGQNSISSLKDEQQVRKRPANIFGTNDIEGCIHGTYEIIANAIDEGREGYGNKIVLNMYKDGVIEVIDDGRGVPMGWNEAEGKYNWELVFCTLYASGKYDSANYGESLGLNGLGATAMQYASEFMEVYSTRDGKTSIMKFREGRPVGELQVVDAMREGTGTRIVFKPDPKVFIGIKDKILPADFYINKLRRQAMLHPGMEFSFLHEGLESQLNIVYPGGILDFIDAICEKPLLKETIYFSGSAEGVDDPELDPEPYKVDMRLGITFTRESNLIEMYHNGSHLYEGGVTNDSLRNGLTKAIDEYAKEVGKITKGDKILFKDIESILIAIGDTNCPGNRTFFKHQVKSAITNPFIKSAYYDFVYHNIKNWLKNNKEADTVISQVLLNKQAREESERVSKKIVQSLSKAVTFGNAPKKFVDCNTKDKSKKELYIVEGDSALGSCKLARDPDFQALIPVRGKIINCLKENLTRILGNDIIRDLIRVLNCGLEVKSEFIEGLPEFDITKLNWDKVIICTDADLDGQQIRCLIITMFYRLVPTLLKEGKVYIAETPLFEITYKKKTYFAYDQAEKDKIMDELYAEGATDSQIKVQRSKGLGENDPEMMSISTMKPETRRLIKVEYTEDDAKVADCFNSLLGDDIETRRMVINEYFKTTEVFID